VQANVPGASLEKLALAITGKAADASLLWAPPPITVGTQIDVAPLLNKLEEEIRQNVVAAANTANKNASFGSQDPNDCPLTFNEAKVNNVFLGGGQAPSLDCRRMVLLELARGVIATLQAGEFDKMGLTPHLFGQYDCLLVQHGGRPGQNSDWPWRDGDFVSFDNNANYLTVHPQGWMSAVQTIRTGPDSYYGWDIDGSQTMWWWFNKLVTEYNADQPQSSQIGVSQIPSPTNNGFINVPKLAQRVFNLRTEQGN
jgi:hypothetical protein